MLKRFLLVTGGLLLAACQPGATADNGEGAAANPLPTEASLVATEPAGEMEEVAVESAELTAEPTSTTPAATAIPSPTPSLAQQLPYLGQAPEVTNDIWINSEQPLRLADLRGKVVLIEFWTFG